ncbi:nucleoside diphosphate kinase 6, mitochondrial [Microcaecilia unicolor]|uniref:Nucleoside diphosphate kinase n=1 Tax=Microcaecilia unicolor TaxID=1415580 RepID=A0A6P7Z9D0_9AMPH|nr:nucleoside diphosphate kinase 6 [Microcaecilia unicolor]XP_030072036.1 nucleoside diphosphate kinase 6 [Microcaecilia unicolor]
MSLGSSVRILQLTLAVIKPDAVAHPVIFKAVHEKILLNKFLIVRSKELSWRREDSQNFYREHSGRFFYQRLVEFMSSGPMRAYILAHEDAIHLWRSLMGPTKVFRARNTEPESIRGMYGLTDTRNTTHGSDSPESANREITFFFPEFNVNHWYQQEEPYFRTGAVSYDSERQIHTVHTETQFLCS